MTKQVMQQALDALVGADEIDTDMKAVIDNLREAIAPPVQPVCYVNGDELSDMLDDRTATIATNISGYRRTPLYAYPIAQPVQPAAVVTDADVWRQGFNAGERWRSQVDAYYQQGNFGSQPKEPPNPYAQPVQPAIGMVTVPRVPTPHMLLLASDVDGQSSKLSRAIWCAMIEAAPSIPIAQPVPQPEAYPVPIDMILHCPACYLQHIDAPDERTPDWKNAPHRSHLCHDCGHIWRPADVATNGVQAVKTVGKADSAAPQSAAAQPVQPSGPIVSLAQTVSTTSDKALSNLLFQLDSQAGSGMIPWQIEDAFGDYQATIAQPATNPWDKHVAPQMSELASRVAAHNASQPEQTATTITQRDNFDAWWEDFSSAHDDWKYADSSALRWAAWQAAQLAQPVQPAPPHECKTDAEKTAFAFGWWKALESVRGKLQPADLSARLADLHLYEEIAEHYALCEISPEALRDWVADRATIAQPVQPAAELPPLPEARNFAEHGIGWFTAGQMQAYARAAIAQPVQPAVSDADFVESVGLMLTAIGYTEEYARQWPKEKVSVTFKRWFDEQIETAKLAQPVPTAIKLPPLPKVGPICYASASDVMEYKPSPEVGTHLPGVRDVALWSTHQMQAYARASIAQPVQPAAVDAVEQDTERLDWLIQELGAPPWNGFWYASTSDYLVKAREAIDAAIASKEVAK